MDAPASTRAATVENSGQQPQRHHMALRSQVSVGGGRSSDNMDTNQANIATLSQQSSVAPETPPSAAEGAPAATPMPTPPGAAGDADPTLTHPWAQPIPRAPVPSIPRDLYQSTVPQNPHNLTTCYQVLND